MEKIIVLGAAGTVGTSVLKYLKDKSVEVFAGIHNENKSDIVKAFGAKPVVVDFQNQENLNKALKGMDRVFLVTPIMQDPKNVTEKVIKAAKINGVKNIVRSTGGGADINGKIQLARWLGECEELVKASGINYTIIRPNSFLQNFINFHGNTIKNYNGFYMPVGSAKAAYIDVDNIGEVCAEVLTSDKYFGKSIDLTGLATTHEEIAEKISKATGRKISFIDVDEATARNSMLDNYMPEWMVDAFLELSYITKQGWTAKYSEDYKNITGKEYTSAKEFFEINKSAFLN